MTLHSVTEIAPKSPFLRVDRSHTRNGFRARAIRHSVNQRTLFTGQSLLCGVKMCLQYFFLHSFFFFNARRSTTLILVFFLPGCLYPPGLRLQSLKIKFLFMRRLEYKKESFKVSRQGRTPFYEETLAFSCT